EKGNRCVAFPQAQEEAWLGQGPCPERLLLLQLSPHLRTPDVVGLLERRCGLLRRGPGRVDRRYTQGGFRPLRQGVGTALPGPPLGCPGRSQTEWGTTD